MRCPVCRNDELTEDFTAYFADMNGCYVIIENVPCRKCSQCGETFFTASVMERLEEIVAGLKGVASKIFIMDYEAA